LATGKYIEILRHAA